MAATVDPRVTSYIGSDAGSTPVSNKAKPLLGWSGADDIPNSRNDVVGVWMNRGSWEELALARWISFNPDLQRFMAAGGQSRAADVGVPLIPHDSQWDLNALLDEAISGSRDQVYRDMGKNLALATPQTAYLRLYWEFNMSPDPANRLDRAKFIAAWRRAVPLIREGFASAARSGQTAKIVWCALSDGAPKMEFYPGDDVVDLVGVDAYGSRWSSSKPTASELITWVAAQLKEIADIGRAQNKPVAMGEWSNWSSHPEVPNGTFDSRGRDDFPEYIDQVFDWAEDPANRVEYLCYYNIRALGTDQIITDTPNSLARYQARATVIQGTTTTTPTNPTNPTTPTSPTTPTTGNVLVSDDGSGTNGTALNEAKWLLGRNPTAGGGGTYLDGAIRLTTGDAGGYAGTDLVARRLNISLVSDVELTFDYLIRGDGYTSAVVRSNKPTDDPGSGMGYALTLHATPRIDLFNNYNTSTLGASTASGTAQDTWYSARFRVVGTKIQARVWPRGTTEPTTWNAGDVTDSTVTAAGSIAFSMAGGGNANSYLALDNVVALIPSSSETRLGTLSVSGSGTLTLSGTKQITPGAGSGTAPFVRSAQPLNYQATGTVTSVVVPVPSGSRAGDVAVVAFATNQATDTLTAPEGWSALTGIDRYTSTPLVSYTFARTLTTADIVGGVTFTFTAGTASRISGVLGIVAGATLNGYMPSSISDTSPTTAPKIPALGGLPPNSLALAITNRRLSQTIPPDFTEPAGWEAGPEGKSAFTSSPNYNSSFFYKVVPPSGDGTAGGETYTSTPASFGATYLVVLPPTTEVIATPSQANGTIGTSTTGTLALTTAKVATSGSLSSAGEGTLALGGRIGARGAIALTAAGTAALAGTRIGYKGTIDLSATGAAAFTASVTIRGTLALSGASNLGLFGSPSSDTAKGGFIVLSGLGTATLAASRITASKAFAPSTEGTLALVGKPAVSGSLATSGSGTVTWAVTIRNSGSMATSGSGSLSLEGFPRAARFGTFQPRVFTDLILEGRGRSTAFFYRALRPIYLGPGAAFARGYNINEVVPNAVVFAHDLTEEVYLTNL